jgi:hypothetical protein
VVQDILKIKLHLWVWYRLKNKKWNYILIPKLKTEKKTQKATNPL